MIIHVKNAKEMTKKLLELVSVMRKNNYLSCCLGILQYENHTYTQSLDILTRT